VVLTYDDAMVQHLDNALPVLDSLNLKATFYLSAAYPGCSQRINDWRNTAKEGHELGNHTLFHPCIGTGAGREWVKPEQDLSKYTVQRIVNEIRMTNTFLEALDGKKKRTFAYTCGDMKIGDTSFIEPLKNEFVAARAVRNQMHKLPEIDLYNVDCYVVNGNTAEQMIEWVKQAEATNSLLVILFHGVNGGNALNVSLPAHSGLLHYLKQNEKEIWIAPMIDVAEFIRETRSTNTNK
jgi:sialate O-acetylesterase